MKKRRPRIRISRRHFVQGTGATALGLLGGCSDGSTTSSGDDDGETGADGEDVVSPRKEEDANQTLQEKDAGSTPDGIEGEEDGASVEAEDAPQNDTQENDTQENDIQDGEGAQENDIQDGEGTQENDGSEESEDDAMDSLEVDDGAITEPETLFYPGATLLDEASFPLGVQAGSATADSIHLWTVLAGEGPWRLVVFADGNGDDPGALIVEGPVVPVENDTAHVDVTYIPSSTWFRYCFYLEPESEDAPLLRSAYGRFRTAPDPGELEVISFGGISCNNINYAPWDALFHAADSALDFFLLAGDTVYADGSSSHENFRSVWRNYLDDPSYRALLQSTSTLATWDDHEVTNNWNPETLDPNVIAAATDTFFEHLPIRRDPDQPNRIWRSHRWGNTLEVFVLDCRSERKPSTQGESNGIYISTEQMTWLKDALTDSPCVFKLILNSVPITNMPFVFDLGADDSWVGYADQREEILSYISNEINGVVWLAGDFHMGALTHVEGEESPHYDQMEVLMGPGGQFANPGWFLLNTGSGASQYNFTTPQFNFVRFVADPFSRPPALYLEFVGSDGDVFYEDVITV